jgi:hypothetical protein
MFRKKGHMRRKYRRCGVKSEKYHFLEGLDVEEV